MSEASEADEVRRLVERAREQSSDAWEELYRRYRPRLVSYALRRLPSNTAAEDAVSEAFARAIAGIDGFTWRGPGFVGWMYGITRNVVLESNRAVVRRRELGERQAAERDVGGRATVESAGDEAAARRERAMVRDVFATLDVDEDFWRWSIDINLKAYLFACQHAIRGMKAAGIPGHVVNFSSISYMMGNAGYAIYTAANGAINAMTRSLAREFGPDGIRLNALAPGWVLTQKQLDKWADPEGLAAHLDRMCLKEHLKPDDIVGPTLFLASEASKMMTGQAMVVDGGVVVTG